MNHPKKLTLRAFAVCLSVTLTVGLASGCSDKPQNDENQYYYSSYYSRISRTQTSGTGLVSSSENTDGTTEAPVTARPSSDASSATRSSATKTAAGGNQTRVTTHTTDSKTTKVFKVESFGAKGDGKTDDGVSVNDAIQEAIYYTSQDSQRSAVVQFGKNKTYRVQKQNFAGSASNASLYVSGARNLTIQGDNTTLIGLPNWRYLQVESCENTTVDGFNFTLDRPVAVRATVTKKSGLDVTFEVPAWFATCVAENKLPDNVFAIPANYKRDHAWIESCAKVDSTHVRFTFRHGSVVTDTYMPIGGKVDLPTPGYAHNGVAFRIAGSGNNVHLKNFYIWNASQFVFAVNGNTGDGGLYFENVNLTPKDKNACPTVAWRDVIHAKDNTCKLYFNKCTFEGTHDDIFNISNTILEVESFYNNDKKELELSGLDYSGNYHQLYRGDHIVAFNPKTDKYYGETTISEVVEQKGSTIHIKLKDDLKLETGAYLYVKERAGAASIKNCVFNGTFRIRTPGTVAENSVFRMLVMWTGYEGNNASVEGPIPENITYKNCTFTNAPGTVASGERMNFDCNLLQAGNPVATSYRTKNIRFESCRFAYKGIINEKNPAVTLKNCTFG